MTVRKWGAETLVNTNVTGNQTLPSIAALNGGGYVVSWTDVDPAGGDGSGASVKFQRYDDAGNRIGAETIANFDAVGDQAASRVIGIEGGGFSIAWQDVEIEYRDFTATGTALDPADRLLTLPGSQSNPVLTTLGTGFAIAFADGNSGTSDIRVQRLLANGNTIVPIIDVAITANQEANPAIAELTSGSLVVAWQDQSTQQIRVRGFDSAGVQTLAPLTVSGAGDTSVDQPTLTALANGSFVVAWTNINAVSPDAGVSVRARIVFSGGLGTEFIINTHTANAQNSANLAALPNGGFVAVYESDGDIRGQVFNAFGVRDGGEFVVNTSTGAGQLFPGVAVLADGRFVVTWADQGASHLDDPNPRAIRQQIFDPRDGVVTGTEAGETLFGHDLGNDEINGLGGADTLNGLGGADSLYGGDGDDIYVVGAGDQLFEFSGGGTDLVQSALSFALAANVENLTLTGTAAANGTGNALVNVLTGNAAANVLNGLAGGDTMLGLAGNDVYVVDNALDTVNETGGSGIDTVVSSIGFTLVASARVIGTLERLVLTGTAAVGNGNASDNIVTGNAINNTLTGAAGNDVLGGVGGNDLMDGGAGNDRLLGGIGIDRLTGGLNNDIFVFDTAPSTTLNRDVITDFNHVADTIFLENAIFTRLPAGALNPNFFHLGAAAADANDFIVYNQANGALFYDPNGNGAGGAIMFAVLASRPAILADDFVVI
jgi:hypothetical protein